MSDFIPEIGITLYQKWYVMPYSLWDVKLFAVESESGQIYKYCNSKEDAQVYVDELNGDNL